MFQKIRVVKNILLGRPILAIFDVTKLCNQRCPMCNIWKTECDSMNIGEIEKKAAELKKFGVGYVFLQGGEPTIRKDILQIADTFIKRGIKPTIITNGILLNDDFAGEVAKRKCNLAISIDSLNPEIYKKMRGVDTLDRVLKNIMSISKFKKRKGNWSITSTITGLSTLDDIKALHDLSRKYGFMYAVRPYIFVNGVAGKKDAELFYKYDDVAEIYDYVISNAEKENFLAWTVYKKHVEYLKGKPMPACDAMKRSFLLKENGQMAPCIEFPGIVLKLGGFFKFRKQYRRNRLLFKNCNLNTPCFYNDAREIGILIKSFPRVIMYMPKIVKQMVTYGNFF